MTEADNENEPLSFIHIAAATANVVRYLKLEEQEQKPGNNKTNPREGPDKSVNHDRAFVERRLRELTDWERRIREDRLRYKNWKRP